MQKNMQIPDVVFGIYLGNEAKAYPKRILAWHEMVKDEVGGIPVNGVYCTLCGAMIAYNPVQNGTHYELGTSGFLYRSNKLMYDKETNSLWSTLQGKPVAGKLVDKGIELDRFHVVTTTWGEWKKRHPSTKVLSFNTGYNRDYGEGVAYKDYFATDELMFRVPFEDERLKRKAEVIALRWEKPEPVQLAIAVDYLKGKKVYQHTHEGHSFVVLVDKSGASRVYESLSDLNFAEFDGEYQLTDAEGGSWVMDELKLNGPDDRVLKRMPHHRAFWFGWHSAYPKSTLISGSE